MKTLVIIAVFLISVNGAKESWLSSRRERSPLETNDTLKLLEALTKFDFFQRLLYDDHKTFYNFHTQGGSMSENISNLHDELLGMSCRLLALSYAYHAIHMIEYFELVGWYIRENADWDSTEESRDLVELHDRRGFCMLTAFYDCDCGIDVDQALASVFFAQSLGRDKNTGYSWKRLLGKMASYQEHYEHYLEFPENSHLPRSTDAERSTRQVKRAITDFSDVFCSRWRPFVPNIPLPEHRGVDYRKHGSMFVRHIFERKTCELQVNRDDTPWNCNHVMRMMQYGYLRYKDTVTQNRIFLEKVIERTPVQKTNVDKKYIYSLGTLRDVFADELVGYKNALNYDEIASTVMLLFSIKEGSKIFTGIKHVVKSKCVRTVDENTGVVGYRMDEDAYAVIHDLRSTLSIFKSFFDHLAVLMLYKKRIDVSKNRHKTQFDSKLNSIVKFLDIQDLLRRTDNGMSVQNMCTGVLSSLDQNYYDAPYAFITDRFSEFFLTSPLLNISQLYRFYAYDYL